MPSQLERAATDVYQYHVDRFSEEELQAWRRWMLTVSQPIHNEMLSLISKNADLLIEDDLPEPLHSILKFGSDSV
jgi:hypothetical protein